MPLVLGFGGDEIAQAFDFDEIELAILEGPASEFAGFGQREN